MALVKNTEKLSILIEHMKFDFKTVDFNMVSLRNPFIYISEKVRRKYTADQKVMYLLQEGEKETYITTFL